MRNNDLVNIGRVYSSILNKVKTVPFVPVVEKTQQVNEKKVPLLDKKDKTKINTFMNRLNFEKLYESIQDDFNDEDTAMQDADALGIDDDAYGDDSADLGMDETGDEDADSVTVTIPRHLAQELCTLLQGVIGDDTAEDGMGEFEDAGIDDGLGDEMGAEDDMGGEWDEDEEDGDDWEDEDEETLADTKGASLQKGMKASGKVTASGKRGGNPSYTNEVDGEAGNLGHPLYGMKLPQDLVGKNNKVKSTKTSTPGKQIFK